MSKLVLANELEKHSGAVLLALRGLQGLESSAFADLLVTIEKCATAYARQSDIPKEIAAVFFDIYPAMVSTSGSYDVTESARIQQAADQVADRIRTCLNR